MSEEFAHLEPPGARSCAPQVIPGSIVRAHRTSGELLRDLRDYLPRTVQRTRRLRGLVDDIEGELHALRRGLDHDLDEAVAELRRLVEQAERDDWNLTRGSQHARCVDSPPDRTDATLREGWRAPLFRGNSVSAFAARETATTRNPSLHRIEQGFRPVAHDGDRWPDLRFSDVIVVRFRSGKESRPGRASSFDWQWCHDEHDIVSWRPAADDEGPPVPYRRASTVPRVVP